MANTRASMRETARFRVRAWHVQAMPVGNSPSGSITRSLPTSPTNLTPYIRGSYDQPCFSYGDGQLPVRPVSPAPDEKLAASRSRPLRSYNRPTTLGPGGLIYAFIGRHPATWIPRCFLSIDKRDRTASKRQVSPTPTRILPVHRCSHVSPRAFKSPCLSTYDS